MQNPESLLKAAEEIVAMLEQHDVRTVVIGAVALASYNYVRLTEDIDLGVNTESLTLRKIADSLLTAGFSAELSEADADDPLGGVIDVTGSFGLLQIINFGGRFPAVIDDAVRDATLSLRDKSPLRIAPLEQLVALKLYAGGYKSKADIAELLARNPDADLPKIRAVCERYRLKGLDEILQ